MNTYQIPVSKRHRLRTRIGRFQQALIEPSARLDDLGLRRTARLLAIFLLILIGLFLLVDIIRLLSMPGYRPPWYGYLLFGGAYLLTRVGADRAAAGLAIAAFPLIIFTTIANQPETGLNTIIHYLVLSVFLGSIFLSWRGLAGLAITNITGLLMLPLLLPVAIPTYANLVTPVAVNTIGAAIALVFLRHRDQIEGDRQAELRASEERYRVISELVSDYAFAYKVDADGSMTLEWITDAFTRLTGYTMEDIWTPEQLAAIIHPEDRPTASQRRRRQLAGHTDVSEYRIIAKDGRTLWQRFYDRPAWDAAENRVVRLYGAVQDITHIKQLEQQLNQAQKMEAIGRLAGGIAHDFNNLLTVILCNAQLSLATPSDVQELQANVGQIQHAAERAAALTRQLLIFSRQQVLEPHLLDLNTLAENTGQLLRRLIGEDIELVMQLGHNVWPVKADPGQIEQVIMNLAVNGRDAMPTGGTLLITTANVDMHDPETNRHIGAEYGSYVVMTIKDTGVGMDAATRAHIFEPFFTTKAPGKGTGLGLATVHGIIAQSGGHIHVDSAPGQGSAFTIYLPRADAAAEPSSADGTPAQAPHGDGTILLVEDEPLLRGLAARVLRRYGYHILEAADGPTALRLSAAYAGSIDLLLTDLVMPGGLSGVQLAEQIVAQRPAIKVLYVSGYTDTAIAQKLLELGQAIVLKPFTPDDLARTIGAIVQRSKQRRSK